MDLFSALYHYMEAKTTSSRYITSNKINPLNNSQNSGGDLISNSNSL